MDPQHPPEVCLHCANGCTHPHELGDDMALKFEVDVCTPVPTVAGSVMRHGGSATDPRTGITVASDRWIRLRCQYCRGEAMTPIEVLQQVPWVKDPEGDVHISTCGACTLDLLGGHKPGHGRHRRRGRRA